MRSMTGGRKYSGMKLLSEQVTHRIVCSAKAISALVIWNKKQDGIHQEALQVKGKILSSVLQNKVERIWEQNIIYFLVT